MNNDNGLYIVYRKTMECIQRKRKKQNPGICKVDVCVQHMFNS